jgi:hypothetical protein
VLIEPRHTPDILRRSIVEAKRIERKIHVKGVEMLLGMMDDVDARHGYLVCPTGHSNAALQRAQDSVRICLIPSIASQILIRLRGRNASGRARAAESSGMAFLRWK